MTRICRPCVREALVSNRVLLQKFGVHFSDILEEYSKRGGRLLKTARLPKTMRRLRLVSSEPIDFSENSWNLKPKVASA
jgi:hypothetical protein